MNLGGLTRKIDLRDLKLGKVQAPVLIPKEYATDVSLLEILWQSNTPTCGAHAGAHLKQILDKSDTGINNYSPRSLWLFIKQIDGYPIESGTDMRSIFKSLQDKGIADYKLLPNVFPTTAERYSDQSALTYEIKENAKPRIIKSYAFCGLSPQSIKQAIYQNKVVLLLADVGDTWWGQTAVTTPTRINSGHFFVAYGYDENSYFVIDSADNYAPLKKVSINYPMRDAGTAIDLPDSVVKAQTQAFLITQLQEIVRLYYILIDLTNRLKGRQK